MQRSLSRLSPRSNTLISVLVLSLVSAGTRVTDATWGVLSDMHDYHDCFGLDRVVECALPWTEIPHVKELRDAGQCVKFSFRVNHDTRGSDMELPSGRSAAEGLSPSFHPNWAPHWPNELEFGFEGGR